MNDINHYVTHIHYSKRVLARRVIARSKVMNDDDDDDDADGLFMSPEENTIA
jgi:hypothetical protein